MSRQVDKGFDTRRERSCEAEDEDQLSLAIGKKGQNARLTSKLTGWKIDILRDESDVSFEEKVARAVEDLARAREVDAKFKKLDLGLVDASIVALAERLGVIRVLTIDSDCLPDLDAPE